MRVQDDGARRGDAGEEQRGVARAERVGQSAVDRRDELLQVLGGVDAELGREGDHLLEKEG